MGGTEGCAEMVTGSPSSPLVAMILQQNRAEKRIEKRSLRTRLR